MHRYGRRHSHDCKGKIVPKMVMLGFLGLCPQLAAASAQDAQISQKIPSKAVIQPVRVQLGAWRSALEAAQGWTRIQQQAAGAMDGLSPRVVHASLPGRGTFYRLWVGPVDPAGVTRFCASLHAKHIDCIPAPG
jgi:SPOR domain